MSGAFVEKYAVEKGDFASAGEVSAQVKRRLKVLGVPSDVVRRVSVACYEVELNLVIHSMGGEISLEISADAVTLDVKDRGPGIPDVELAMSEGWSTASDEVRMLGFGAGMGLPNMRRNADEFELNSTVGVGTEIHMMFRLKQDN